MTVETYAFPCSSLCLPEQINLCSLNKKWDAPVGLLTQMVEKLSVPVICEGVISSPAIACQAINLGAYAVVVGAAITGIDYLVKAIRKNYKSINYKLKLNGSLGYRKLVG